MRVKVEVEGNVNLSPFDALRVLYEEFYIKENEINLYVEKEINGVKGVYYAYDDSMHGSCHCKYALISESKTFCEIIKNLRALQYNLYKFYDEEKEKKNTRKRTR